MSVEPPPQPEDSFRATAMVFVVIIALARLYIAISNIQWGGFRWRVDRVDEDFSPHTPITRHTTSAGLSAEW